MPYFFEDTEDLKSIEHKKDTPSDVQKLIFLEIEPFETKPGNIAGITKGHKKKMTKPIIATINAHSIMTPTNAINFSTIYSLLQFIRLLECRLFGF